MNEFIPNPYSQLFIHKRKESEAYLASLSILLVNVAINHRKEYQDNVNYSKCLTIGEQLNVDADKIATTCAKIPINIHLLSTSFAIYKKGKYVHLPPHKTIREVSFEYYAKQFLQTKYN